MSCKQDMPPPGGYAPITYEHVPLKKGAFGARSALLMMGGVMAVGMYRLFGARNTINNENIEMRCSKQALAPLFEAEADRTLLKQLKRNRDTEEKIMKNVKGWEVGKFYKTPVYKSIGPDEFFKPHKSEYFTHTDERELYESVFLLKKY